MAGCSTLACHRTLTAELTSTEGHAGFRLRSLVRGGSNDVRGHS